MARTPSDYGLRHMKRPSPQELVDLERAIDEEMDNRYDGSGVFTMRVAARPTQIGPVINTGTLMELRRLYVAWIIDYRASDTTAWLEFRARQE